MAVHESDPSPFSHRIARPFPLAMEHRCRRLRTTLGAFWAQGTTLTQHLRCACRKQLIQDAVEVGPLTQSPAASTPSLISSELNAGNIFENLCHYSRFVSNYRREEVMTSLTRWLLSKDQAQRLWLLQALSLSADRTTKASPDESWASRTTALIPSTDNFLDLNRAPLDDIMALLDALPNTTEITKEAQSFYLERKWATSRQPFVPGPLPMGRGTLEPGFVVASLTEARDLSLKSL
jgi:hypothetical protein